MSEETASPVTPPSKPTRKVIYIASALSAAAIGYIVHEGATDGPVRAAAVDGAFWTIWISIAGLAVGNTTVGELVALALGKWLGRK